MKSRTSEINAQIQCRQTITENTRFNNLKFQQYLKDALPKRQEMSRSEQCEMARGKIRDYKEFSNLRH